MIYMVRRISLRSRLQEKTSLTAVHDINDAWSGIGAATIGLSRQIHLPADYVAVSIAMLYLLGISILHITSPALLGLQTYSPSTPLDILTRGVTNYLNDTANFTMQPLALGQSASPGIYGADTAITLYRMNATLPGVNGPLFYDVPENNRATAALGVSSMLFKVTCSPADHLFFDVDGNGTLIASGYWGTPSQSEQTASSGYFAALSRTKEAANVTIFGKFALVS
jgi:hypothetical protein